MKPTIPYYIEGSRARRPASKATAYVDGTAATFREGQDIELSHWVVNRTPARYKAPSSTEICFKYLDHPDRPYDLVVNNHLDIDGLLSMFVLAYPDFAQRHRTTIIQAAEMGDFMFWADGKALHITADTLEIIQQDQEPMALATLAFERIIEILKHENDPHPFESLLTNQLNLLKSGDIQQYEVTDHLTIFKVSAAVLSKTNLAPQIAPQFYSEYTVHPCIRNYYDKEKIQVIALEKEDGWHYEVYAPTYWWADTQGLWRPDWVQLKNGRYEIIHPKLAKILDNYGISYNFDINLHGTQGPSYPMIAKSGPVNIGRHDLNSILSLF